MDGRRDARVGFLGRRSVDGRLRRPRQSRSGALSWLTRVSSRVGLMQRCTALLDGQPGRDLAVSRARLARGSSASRSTSVASRHGVHLSASHAQAATMRRGVRAHQDIDRSACPDRSDDVDRIASRRLREPTADRGIRVQPLRTRDRVDRGLDVRLAQSNRDVHRLTLADHVAGQVEALDVRPPERDTVHARSSRRSGRASTERSRGGRDWQRTSPASIVGSSLGDRGHEDGATSVEIAPHPDARRSRGIQRRWSDRRTARSGTRHAGSRRATDAHARHDGCGGPIGPLAASGSSRTFAERMRGTSGAQTRRPARALGHSPRACAARPWALHRPRTWFAVRQVNACEAPRCRPGVGD